MLCVPKIIKNLLSIAKFTRDNNVIVQFHADHCVIKDKQVSFVLSLGSLKTGLYQLHIRILVCRNNSSRVYCFHPVVPQKSESQNSSSSHVFVNNKASESTCLHSISKCNVSTYFAVMNKVYSISSSSVCDNDFNTNVANGKGCDSPNNLSVVLLIRYKTILIIILTLLPVILILRLYPYLPLCLIFA